MQLLLDLLNRFWRLHGGDHLYGWLLSCDQACIRDAGQVAVIDAKLSAATGGDALRT